MESTCWETRLTNQSATYPTPRKEKKIHENTSTKFCLKLASKR